MQVLLITFIKLFVATDALGTLPLFLNLTEGMEETQKRRAIRLSVVTSAAIMIVFITIGRWLLAVLDVSVADFRIAGGLLLLILSIDGMVHDVEAKARSAGDMVGVVPLGTPLIAGPCMLTLVLVLSRSVGIRVTFVAAMANIVIAAVVFSYSDLITRILGRTGSKAFAKVSSLLLAGIAITMVRRGVLEVIEDVRKVWSQAM